MEVALKDLLFGFNYGMGVNKLTEAMPKLGTKTYLTNCSESGNIIGVMLETAEDITLEEFLSEVDVIDLLKWHRDKYPWYQKGDDVRELLHDRCASFGKGIYEELPCVYLRSSGVEFVFL